MRVNDNKKKAFLAAYDASADALYRFCFFRVFNKERAEELVQETFMRAWQYVNEVKDVEHMRAFLYRVANNLIIDEYRKKKEESLEMILAASPGAEPMTEDHKMMQQSVLMGEVREKLNLLSEEERELVTMRYLEDLDPKQIAEILHISANNVSVRLNRAVKKLGGFMNNHVTS